MRSLRRGPTLFGAAAAAITVAVVASVALIPAAHADEIEQPAPDPVTSLTLGEICGDSCPTFGAKALVPPDVLRLPGFEGLGLGFDLGMRVPVGSTAAAQQAQAVFLGSVLALGQVEPNVKRAFQDINIEMASQGDPLFANYRLNDDTPPAGQPGGQNASGSSGGTSYELSAKGSTTLSYGCKATVRVGNETADMNANWSFMGGNGGPSGGRMGLDSHIRLFGERLKLNLSGIATFSGTNTYNVTVNGSAFSFGFSGTLTDGMTYSISGAVSSSGELLGLSIGGSANIGILPVQIRIDFKPGTVGVGSQLAPGLEITGSTSGDSSSFGIKVDLAKFGPWFQRLVSGQ